MVDSKLIEAFHLMWGNFPEPATLVHKSKEVIATNLACEGIGLAKGMNCATHGPAEAHKGCLANKALRSQQAAYKKAKYGEREIISYWLPVDGYPELFVHFGVGATINYSTMPKKVPCTK